MSFADGVALAFRGASAASLSSGSHDQAPDPGEPLKAGTTVPVGDLTGPEAVRKALQEFDERGREDFLAHYGFGPAHRYYIREDGKLYDSKAIVGVAHGIQHPD